MASIVVSGDTSGAVTITAPAIAGTTTLTLPTTSGTLVVTGGAQTIEFADGTVSAPSITNSGDTNTGIYFPAADTIAFTEGGVESMRIDSSGNVGIGTSSPTTQRLHISAASVSGPTNNPAGIRITDTGTSENIQLVNRSGNMLYNVETGNNYSWQINSSEVATIDSSGNVGIGTSSPNGKVDIVSSSAGANTNTLFLTNSSGTAGTATSLVFGVGSDPTNRQAVIRGINAGGNAINLAFLTSNADVPAERMRIDPSGRLLINTTTARTTLDGDRSALVQIEGLSVDQSMSMFRNENGAFGPTFWIGKSRGTTAGSNTVVQNGDGLGSISFLGSDGTKPVQSALIGAFVDGTPGTNDMPGRLVFYTTADGASSVTERMRITAAGELLVGTTNTNPTGNNVGGLAITDSGNILRVSGDGTPALRVNRKTSDGSLVSFSQDGTEEGNISVSGTTVSYNGGHLSRWSQLPNNQKDDTILKGTVMSNLDDMCVWTKDGEELPNEQLNKMKVSDVEGDINVAGVFVNWTFDEECQSEDMNVAMTGDMIIRIAQGVVVQKGDLLMSAGDGTAKPQGDDIVRSKTVAKVTSNHVTCTYEDGSYCVPCVLMAC